MREQLSVKSVEDLGKQAMKICELCKSPATTYCESDEACLCWNCDGKVHGVNFLVARHSRCLLCYVCQSPTPWKATGSKLGNTISTCERCTVDSADYEEEIDTNQVVPLSYSSSMMLPPDASSSCSSKSSEEDSEVLESPIACKLKRVRENDSDLTQSRRVKRNTYGEDTAASQAFAIVARR